MARQYYSVKFKVKVIRAYEQGDLTIKEICSKFTITKTSFYK